MLWEPYALGALRFGNLTLWEPYALGTLCFGNLVL